VSSRPLAVEETIAVEGHERFDISVGLEKSRLPLPWGYIAAG
jgi:hypothetical protein